MTFPPQPCWIFQHVGCTISARTMPALFPWYSKGEQSRIVGFQDGPSNFILSAPVVFNGSTPKYLTNTFLIMCNGRSLRSSSIPSLRYIESWRSNHGCLQKCMSCIVYIVLVWILCTKRESKRLFNDEQPYYITQLPFPHRCSQSCKKLPVILLEPEWSGHLGRIQLLNCQKVSLAFWLLSCLRFSFLAFAKPAVFESRLQSRLQRLSSLLLSKRYFSINCQVVIAGFLPSTVPQVATLQELYLFVQRCNFENSMGNVHLGKSVKWFHPIENRVGRWEKSWSKRCQKAGCFFSKKLYEIVDV